MLLLCYTILFKAINYKKIFIIKKENWLKKIPSLKNILKKDINIYTNIFKEDEKQINELCDKLAK